ncbi:MAG: hypothetical protein A2W91_03670 [Bacteroidetes bacterium GWF2_38_335]|nr:MAG: hypothetical protein A2W91_03670 [Bacteroidetes bacterium GWF2_38_335]OFY77418.1 MAG: hypothetical protein A2281_01090 [Bacteroidetes bacterium RIFOXYA12_FULL_38_20]HBS87294.1 hypothetical protein [Bacteroidales bacterium]
MKKLLILTLVLFGLYSFAQEKKFHSSDYFLTKADSVYFESLPKFTMANVTAASQNKSLPYVVDNSLQSYFRPVFAQSSLDCGQASSVGICFASEINFLRGVSGSLPENQYPTFFTYNFQNDGTGYSGVSYMHTFEVLKACGTPNSVVYGGMYNGDDTIWMSGYDKYYHAMHNRLTEAFTIEAGTPEGLEVLKRWIYDHCDGSTGGGYAVFYAQCCGASATLPAGTEEAGKYCHPTWGSSANHAMCIVGYNDSIRYDFNGDGEFTNNIDINSDGIVDMRDWEIGGLKYCNTYAGGPSWGNGGFCYMFYKALADDITNGGIWNHSVQILRPQRDCQPLLTLKATVTHNKRNRVKIYAGFSTNTAATTPDYVMEFPAFNFQGGGFYMQGGWTIPANGTLELGLDITPFLNIIESGQDVKYFLIFQESDAAGTSTGLINHFSILNYTAGTEEIVYPDSDIPINENGTLYLGIVENVVFDTITITTTDLPDVTVYEDYSFQMEAANGNDPYTWDIIQDYAKTQFTGSFPAMGSNIVTLNSAGYAVIELPFDFPYYDEYVNKIAIRDEGCLHIIGDLYPWPYNHETQILAFHKYKMIAPMFSDLMSVFASQSDEISYTMNSDSITIVFDMSKSSDYSDVKFAVRLLKNGNIKFFYGTLSTSIILNEIIGIAEGDHRNFVKFTENLNAISNKNYLLERPQYPMGLKLSVDGLLSGVMDEPVFNVPLIFQAVDENHLKNRKTLFISSNGLIIDYATNCGTNAVIDYGENITLDMSLHNTFISDITSAVATINSTDPYITITDNTETVGTIPALTEVDFNDAFAISIHGDIPDNHVIPASITVVSGASHWTRNINLTARSPIIEFDNMVINDGDDGLLDPGETADLLITYKNTGGSAAYNVNIDYSTLDPNITINTTPPSPAFAIIEPDSLKTVVLNISIDAAADSGYVAGINSHFTADYGYIFDDLLYLGIGLIIEDFETGDMSAFSWSTSGNNDWFVSDELPYEGAYCIESGDIADNESSVLSLAIEVLQPGTISFFKKVSCEDGPSENYDFLKFSIDGVQKGIWDGTVAWSESSYSVTAGVHLFEWAYVKDYSVSTGSDCAWVDYITFPTINNSLPELSINPDSVVKTMLADQIDSDTISLSNIGGGIIEYNVLIDFSSASMKSISNTKSIAGSYVECLDGNLYTGTPYAITFRVFNASPDNEWLKDLYINFPENIRVDSATNFVGGSGGPLVYDGTTGDNITINWHGEDAEGWGVVHASEAAIATVYIYVDTAVTEDVTFVYTIQGEVYGADPHTIVSDITVPNFGNNQPWITLDNETGSVIMLGTNDLVLNFNTYGMEPGTYTCDLLIENTYNDLFILPVTLIVTTEINVPEIENNSYIKNFPNPFNDITVFEISEPSQTEAELSIYNSLGEKVITLFSGTLSPGISKFTWNGSGVAEGVYYYKYSNDKTCKTGNIIFVNY